MRLNFAPIAVIFVVVFVVWFFTGGTAKADTVPFYPGTVLFGSGSGAYVSADGYILTVAHVACIPNSNLTIVQNGIEYSAASVICDVKNDIALIFTNHVGDPLALANGEVSPGDNLYTAGFPLPEIYNNNPIFAEGIATGNIDAHFQAMNLPIAPGHSGSPVVDGCGNVVGTVNAVAMAEGQLMQGMDISSRASNIKADIAAQGINVALVSRNVLDCLLSDKGLFSKLDKSIVQVNIYMTEANALKAMAGA